MTSVTTSTLSYTAPVFTSPNNNQPINTMTSQMPNCNITPITTRPPVSILAGSISQPASIPLLNVTSNMPGSPHQPSHSQNFPITPQLHNVQYPQYNAQNQQPNLENPHFNYGQHQPTTMMNHQPAAFYQQTHPNFYHPTQPPYSVQPQSYIPPHPHTGHPYGFSKLIQLPPFKKADPVLWFKQVEMQFNLCHINNEEIQYNTLVAALPDEACAEARDLIVTRPLSLPYSNIKARILLRFTRSVDERIHKVLNEESLGDRRPTQLLLRMQSLLADCNAPLDSTFLKSLFVSKMPDYIRMHLATTIETTTVEILAENADKILRARQNGSVNSVSSHNYENSQNFPKQFPILYQQHQPTQQYNHTCHCQNTTVPHPPAATAQEILPTVSVPTMTPTPVQSYFIPPTPETHILAPSNDNISVNAVAPKFNENTTLNVLSKQIAKLAVDMENLKYSVGTQNNTPHPPPFNNYNQRSRAPERAHPPPFNNYSQRTRTPERQRNRSPSPHPQRYTQQNPDDVCFYHHRFGDHARRCLGRPCKYYQGN